MTAMFLPPSNGVSGTYTPLWSRAWNALGVADFNYSQNFWSQQDDVSTFGTGLASWTFPEWLDISH